MSRARGKTLKIRLMWDELCKVESALVLAGTAVADSVTLASADTLQLSRRPYGQAGPYLFSVNGSTTLTPLICYSEHEVYVGESVDGSEFYSFSQSAASRSISQRSGLKNDELGCLVALADPHCWSAARLATSILRFGRSSPVESRCSRKRAHLMARPILVDAAR